MSEADGNAALQPTAFIDSQSEPVRDFVDRHAGTGSDRERAIRLYRSLGFVEEGRLRQAQFKGGRFIDVVLMSILRDEFKRAE